MKHEEFASIARKNMFLFCFCFVLFSLICTFAVGKMKLTKNRFLLGFAIVVALLALVRFVFDSDRQWTAVQTVEATDSIVPQHDQEPVAVAIANPKNKPHRIVGVQSYHAAFPDSNEVQLTAANQWGVTPVQNRENAEHRMNELVYVGASPYYYVDKLGASIPYLVPRASILLQDIGRAFLDSLYVKGVPMHRIIVTSLLRTQEDVEKLRKRNGNATENSCHLYGTTFDICYNRYKTVSDPDGPERRMVQNDTLKWVLCEVLRDMREQQRCYIKYEVKQGCFHMTVR